MALASKVVAMFGMFWVARRVECTLSWTMMPHLYTAFLDSKYLFSQHTPFLRFYLSIITSIEMTRPRLDTLPAELTLKVIDELRTPPHLARHSPPRIGDLAALARISKRLHGPANGAIYREIPLDKCRRSTQTILLLETLITRREYIKLVKEICLYGYEQTDCRHHYAKSATPCLYVEGRSPTIRHEEAADVM